MSGNHIKLFIYRSKIKGKKAWNWLWAHFVIIILETIKFFPARAALNLFSSIACILGPLMHRHQIALSNLRLAFPEKTEKEIHCIAREMWKNMGRLLAEYVFLDKIFDLDLSSDAPGIVEFFGVEFFKKIKTENRPHILFTAHTGNFELLPICAAAFDLNVKVLFRPPNNPYIARRVLRARKTDKGYFVPSRAGAAWALASTLNNDGNVGILVDQKFRRGIPGTFFNHPVKTNPLLAKLARQFNCDVYPVRCIRLAGGRYRLEICPPLDLPLTDNGTIDIVATTQKLNDVVETWVREYPGQWMWFHKRWG